MSSLDGTRPDDRVLDATLQVVREAGIAGVSARAVARAGGFSQSLIYYHHDSVEALLVAACDAGSARRVARWAGPLAGVATLTALVDLAEELHASEEEEGNVAVLAQFLAGAQTHPGLAEASGRVLDRWMEVVEPVVTRLVDGTPLAGLASSGDLAALVGDAFVGIELAASTRDETALARRFATLRGLAGLVDAFEELGPVTTRTLTRWVARRGQARSRGA